MNKQILVKTIALVVRMKYVISSFRKSRLKISALSLGSWVTFGKQVYMSEAKALLKTAYDGEIDFFDNAEVYEAGESEK
jgi:aryl-alcohol dehydrogenase-like predicted oxidoreductase